MAKSEEVRRQLVQTDLFREAQDRLTILEQKEAAEFARIVQQAQTAFPDGGYRPRMEGTE